MDKLIEKWRNSDNEVVKNAIEICDKALQMSPENQKFCLGIMYGLEMQETNEEGQKGA